MSLETILVKELFVRMGNDKADTYARSLDFPMTARITAQLLGEGVAPACGSFGVQATGVYGIRSSYTAIKF